MSSSPITAVYVFLPIDQDTGHACPSTCVGRAALEKEVALWEFNATVEDLTEPQRLDLAEIVNSLIDIDLYTFSSGRILQSHRVRLPADYAQRLAAQQEDFSKFQATS